jgi:hypothetical protein
LVESDFFFKIFNFFTP